MVESAEKVEKLKRIMKARLADRASVMLVDRMAEQLDRVIKDSWDLKACLEGIRVALRLFVGEDLAESIHRELMTVAGMMDQL